jgi:hypothetical protein
VERVTCWRLSSPAVMMSPQIPMNYVPVFIPVFLILARRLETRELFTVWTTTDLLDLPVWRTSRGRCLRGSKIERSNPLAEGSGYNP